MAPTDTSPAGATFHPYPAGIAHVIDGRPLLWFERPEEYDALRAAVFAELPLKDPVDYILGKDFVDLLWERRRAERLKAATVNFAMPVAMSKLIRSGEPWMDDEELARAARPADHVAYGGERLRAQSEPILDARMRDEGVTPEMLHLLCRVEASERLAIVARECDRIEVRTHRLLRDIEARSVTLAAMAKSLVERERAVASKCRGES